MEARAHVSSLIRSTHADCLDLVAFEDVVGTGEWAYASVCDSQSGIVGHGDSSHADEAWLRAYAEWCERFVWSCSKAPTTSGFSAHTDPALAREGALNELIEHDAVLGCWLSKRAPAWIRDVSELRRIQPWAGIVQNDLRHCGIELDVGLQAVTGNVFTAVALGRFSFAGGGLFVTSGSSSVLSIAIEKALREARRTANALVTRHRRKLHFAESAAGLKGPEGHRDYWLRAEHGADIDWFMAGSSDVSVLEPFATTYAVFELPFTPALPLTVVRAESNEAQRMFWGPLLLENVAHARLPLQGTPNTVPHPYA